MLSWKYIITHNFPDEIVIYLLSDVHYGALEHNTTAWESVLKEILAEPNRYCVLNGDLISNGTKNSLTNCFDEIVRPRDQKKYMVEALAPIKERILCLTRGNHEYRNKDVDNDITYDIASKLDIEDLYRPEIAFLNIRLGSRGEKNPNSARNSYNIAVTHGTGGGVLSGSTINRNERTGNIIENLDVFIVGHTHKGIISRPSKLVIDPVNGIVEQRDYVVISCVSWMEYGGYAASKMLLPAAHSRPQKILLGKNGYGQKDIRIVW